MLVATELQSGSLENHQNRQLKSSTSILVDEEARKIRAFHDLGPPLFYHSDLLTDTSIETNLLSLASVHQEAFFGRTCGFQFCDSLKIPLTLCAVLLASYNDGYEAFANKENSTPNSNMTSPSTPMSTLSSSPSPNGNSNSLSPSPSNPSFNTATNNGTQFTSIQSMFGQAAKTLFSSTKYTMDPELRAKKISSVMKNANVDFCKAFWQLTETPMVQVGSNMVTPNLGVNIVKRISLATPLRLPKCDSDESGASNRKSESSFTSQSDFVDVMPPVGANPTDTVKIRILSYEMLQGMVSLKIPHIGI